jgi:hypothetical protein
MTHQNTEFSPAHAQLTNQSLSLNCTPELRFPSTVNQSTLPEKNDSHIQKAFPVQSPPNVGKLHLKSIHGRDNNNSFQYVNKTASAMNLQEDSASHSRSGELTLDIFPAKSLISSNRKNRRNVPQYHQRFVANSKQSTQPREAGLAVARKSKTHFY